MCEHSIDYVYNVCIADDPWEWIIYVIGVGRNSAPIYIVIIISK